MWEVEEEGREMAEDPEHWRVYPVIGPLRSEGAGGSQVRVRLVGPGVAWNASGGPVGPGGRTQHTAQYCSHCTHCSVEW